MAWPIDSFAGRKGGVRGPSEGRDTALWHYLHAFSSGVIKVIHLNFSTDGHADLLKAKALSQILCQDPITSNANKCILVERQSALYTFGGSYPGSILSRSAISLALGINSPSAIAASLGQPILGSSSRADRIRDVLKNM